MEGRAPPRPFWDRFRISICESGLTLRRGAAEDRLAVAKQCSARFRPCGDSLGETFHPASGCDVGKPHLRGEGGDEEISTLGQIGGDTALVGGERGHNQEPSGGQRGPEFRSDSPRYFASRAQHDGLPAAKQDPKTLLFHGGVEAADHGPA